jgi:hypothetical protein
MIHYAPLTAQSPKLISLYQVHTQFSRSLTSSQVILLFWPAAERTLMAFITMANHQHKRLGFLGGLLENVFGRWTGSRLSKIAKHARLPSVAGLLQQQLIHLIKPLHDSTSRT